MWSKTSPSQNSPTTISVNLSIDAIISCNPKKNRHLVNHLLGFLVVMTVKAVHQSRITESWTLPSPTKGVQASSPAFSIHQLTFSGASSKSNFNGGNGGNGGGGGSLAFLLDLFLPFASRCCKYKISICNHEYEKCERFKLVNSRLNWKRCS